MVRSCTCSFHAYVTSLRTIGDLRWCTIELKDNSKACFYIFLNICTPKMEIDDIMMYIFFMLFIFMPFNSYINIIKRHINDDNIYWIILFHSSSRWNGKKNLQVHHADNIHYGGHWVINFSGPTIIFTSSGRLQFSKFIFCPEYIPFTGIKQNSLRPKHTHFSRQAS